MELLVRGARAEEAKFAWPLYRNFIVENLFSGQHGRLTIDRWDESEEKRKFLEAWSVGDKFVIQVDEQTVGWASSSQVDNVLTVENVFISPGWQNQGVAEKLFEEMIAVWKRQNLTVDVPILKNTPQSAVVEAALVKLGFQFDKEDAGLLRVMRGNWTH